MYPFIKGQVDVVWGCPATFRSFGIGCIVPTGLPDAPVPYAPIPDAPVPDVSLSDAPAPPPGFTFRMINLQGSGPRALPNDKTPRFWTESPSE